MKGKLQVVRRLLQKGAIPNNIPNSAMVSCVPQVEKTISINIQMVCHYYVDVVGTQTKHDAHI